MKSIIPRLLGDALQPSVLRPAGVKSIAINNRLHDHRFRHTHTHSRAREERNPIVVRFVVQWASSMCVRLKQSGPSLHVLTEHIVDNRYVW